MMQPRTVKVHVAQISEVTVEFVEKMRAMRDSKSLEMPANFANELHKWALECEYTRVCSAIPLEEESLVPIDDYGDYAIVPFSISARESIAAAR